MLSFLGLVSSLNLLHGQAFFGAGSSTAWLVGGNTGITTRNVIGPTWSNTLAVRPQMWFTTGATTTGIYRMMINDGATAITDGYIAMGNDLPATFVPQARLHLHQSSGVVNQKFSTPTTGSGASSGFDIGMTNGGLAFFRNWTSSQPIQFANHDVGTSVSEKMRITSNLAPNQNGYMGLNQPNPFAHIELSTPAFAGNECFFAGRASDVTVGRVGLYNSSPINGRMVPGLFGITDPSETSSALRTVASIDVAQDLPLNAAPITQFSSAMGLPFPLLFGGGPVVNRDLFGWSNGGNINMLMSNLGRMRIMASLAPLTNRPNNRLELTTSAGDPYGLTGSGLRFTNMTCANTIIPQCNPANPVFLSVDSNGDVILVGPPPSSTSFFGLCPALPSLPSDAGTNLAGNNFYFDGNSNGPNRNNVFIGLPCNATPRGKLQVLQNSGTDGTTGIFVENRDGASTGVAYGIDVLVPGVLSGLSLGYTGVRAIVSGEKNVIGVEGIANGNSSTGSDNKGGRFVSQNSGGRDIGVEGISLGTSSNIAGLFNSTNFQTAFYNTGVEATSVNFNSGVIDNIGVFGYAKTDGGISTNNVGVVGLAQETNGGSATESYGLYGEGSSGAAYFVGGTTNSGPAFITSDQKIKRNVETVKNSLAIIQLLNPVTYDYKREEYPELHLSETKQYGFIAQELEKVVPELVKQSNKPEIKNSKGEVISKSVSLKTVNYDGMIPILAKAMQEQQVLIDEQQKTNTALQTQINELKALLMAQSNNETLRNKQTLVLSDGNAVVLDQNVPNPFAEQTLISYVLPENFGKAQMQFFDKNGKLIKVTELTTKGRGQLTVFADNLSEGLYTYSLIIDGVIVGSKQMLKNN